MPDEGEPIGKGSTTLDYLLHKYPWLRGCLKEKSQFTVPASGTALLIEMDTKEALAVEGSLRVVAEFGGSFGVGLNDRANCNRVAARIKNALDRAATVAAPDLEDTTDGKG